MLKYALLGAAMIVAAPVVAQTKPVDRTDPSPQAPTAQTPSSADPMTADAAQTAAAPVQDPAAQPAPATGATTQTATSETQIAQVVDTQFGTYDKDANGTLNAAEFGSWMVALRQATDASVTADSKAMKSWTKTAFTQADTDKSKSVSKTELTGFLASNKG